MALSPDKACGQEEKPREQNGMEGKVDGDKDKGTRVAEEQQGDGCVM